jgi:membrane protein DedA with SNARE-associated domain
MVEFLDSLVRGAGPVALLVLFFSAAVEYLFPPFPGDTVTLLGGVYAVRGGLSPVAVYLSILAGSLAGAMADYGLGRYLGRRLEKAREDSRLLRRIPREQIHEWERRFRERGALWLVVNRFLPGVRGPIFLAAGISGLSPGKVLFWGGLSAALWNGLFFAAGYAVGGKAERLEEIVTTYGRAVWISLAAVGVGLLIRWAWRRRAGARA